MYSISCQKYKKCIQTLKQSRKVKIMKQYLKLSFSNTKWLYLNDNIYSLHIDYLKQGYDSHLSIYILILLQIQNKNGCEIALVKNYSLQNNN